MQQTTTADSEWQAAANLKPFQVVSSISVNCLQQRGTSWQKWKMHGVISAGCINCARCYMPHCFPHLHPLRCRVAEFTVKRNGQWSCGLFILLLWRLFTVYRFVSWCHFYATMLPLPNKLLKGTSRCALMLKTTIPAPPLHKHTETIKNTYGDATTTKQKFERVSTTTTAILRVLSIWPLALAICCRYCWHCDCCKCN